MKVEITLLNVAEASLDNAMVGFRGGLGDEMDDGGHINRLTSTVLCILSL